MSKTDICVVHVFPYSPTLSGGHSNAIRGFIACQRGKQINAVGIAPKPDAAAAQSSWDFPLFEVDSLWDLRWATIARHFSILPANSLLHFHSVDVRFAPLLRDLRRAFVPYVFTSQGQLNFRGLVHWLKKFVYLNFVHRGPRTAAGLHVLATVADHRLRRLLPAYRGLTLIQGNLVQLPNPAELRAGSRSDYGVPSDAFLLVFLGRLDVWVKGLDVLVQALSRLPSGRFHLVMAGPDWEGGKAELKQLAEQYGCGRQIHFIGPVYGGDKWALLQMADLFVSPSRWEAFSTAHAEALALGLPVITSDRITIAQDLREADAAVLVPVSAEPLGKAIAALAADPQRRRALSIRAKAWAEKNCDPGRAGSRFEEFYHSLLERSRSAGG